MYTGHKLLFPDAVRPYLKNYSTVTIHEENYRKRTLFIGDSSIISSVLAQHVEWWTTFL
jgi:hypothetical protein